ncbi:MAG: hypothetical protein ACI8R4_003572 [Paracoccaceae bacterium]|jgi:hypothetical protein
MAMRHGTPWVIIFHKNKGNPEICFIVAPQILGFNALQQHHKNKGLHDISLPFPPKSVTYR